MVNNRPGQWSLIRLPCRTEVIEALQQLAEFSDGQAGVANDSSHRVSLDGVVAWQRDLAGAVGHHNRLALSDDPGAGPTQSPVRVG